MRAAGFSEPQISRVESGGVVARLRRLREDNAAFVVGVAKIGCHEARLVEQLRNVGGPDWQPTGRILQAGRFGTPPTLEDLRALRLERRDIRDLRRCRVGDCDLQVDRRTMEAARAIDWRAGDAEATAGRLLKSMLLERVSAYLRDGAGGLPAYDDGRAPAYAVTGLDYVLQNSPAVRLRDPLFADYLLRFPNGAPPLGLEQFVIWSKMRATRPVVSIVHVFIQHVPDGRGTRYDIALEHVYDSHFFLAYVEFMTLLPAPGTDHGFYLLRSVRALINPPHGWLRGILLRRIKHAMRDQLAEDMAETKRILEAAAGRR